MKHVLWFVLASLLFGTAVYAAPISTLLRNTLPETTNIYDLGTSTAKWNRLFANYASTTALNAVTICLDGDACRTTWPSSAATLGTVATGTAETAGQLSFFTTTNGYPARLGSVATGTLSATYPLQTNASRFVVGGNLTISSALATTSQNTWVHQIFDSLFATNASSTNATTTSLYVTDLTSALSLFDANSRATEYAGTSCTNQFVRSLSAAAVATCATVVPADVDLTASWDFGSATGFEIPNGSGPTVNGVGEIALDTTANQLLVATSSNASFPAVFSMEDDKGGIFSTSTLDYLGAFGASGTTTVKLFAPKRAQKITDFYCTATGAGTSTVRIGNGSASSSYAVSGNFAVADLSNLSIAVAARGAIYVEFGTLLGTPDYWSCNYTSIQDRL